MAHKDPLLPPAVAAGISSQRRELLVAYEAEVMARPVQDTRFVALTAAEFAGLMEALANFVESDRRLRATDAQLRRRCGDLAKNARGLTDRLEAFSLNIGAEWPEEE